MNTVSKTQPDTPALVSVKADSVYPVTRLGDTPESPDEEIAIEMHRWRPDTVTFVAVGDIMPGTGFPNPSYLPNGKGEYLWNDVSVALKKADVTFGNLEGTILDSGGEQKACKNPNLCYLFRIPEYLTENFTDSGFDLMSVANNHANDFGKTGRLNTQRVLDRLNIAHAGSVEQPYIIKKIGRLNIGFCAFSPNKGTASIHSYEKIGAIIRHLDSLSDIVVASFHAGAEGSKNRRVTRKREFYHGEDRGNVYELAHLMVDNGADVIIGHGPHVVRAIEVYKKRMIAYSLGNFLTYGRFNLRGLAGEAPLLEIETDAKGMFLEGQIHSFRQSYSSGPRIDSTLSVGKTIKKLSLMDFRENPIEIDDSGKISYVHHR